MPLNGDFAKLMGYLTSVIFQLGLYCTLGSNLMSQVNIKRLLLFMMVSCSFLYFHRLRERLILSWASFYAFIISFLIFFFLFLTSSDCCLQGVELLTRILTELIHWVIEMIIRLLHDAIHNVVFTKRRKQWKNKSLRIWKQVILTYCKFISLQSADKTMEHKGSVQWG